MKQKFAPIAAIMTLVIFFSAFPSAVPSTSPPSEKSRLTMSGVQRPLGDVLEQIGQEYDIEFEGLSDFFSVTVTFSFKKEPIEKALKRLFRQTDIANYAFEYDKNGLKRVSVLPHGKEKTATSLTDTSPAPEQTSEKGEPAVRIVKVNKGTQAENLDLQTDDLVIEYNGNPIRSAGQLIQEVKKTSPEDSVEMIVVRDGVPFRVPLNGGLIGINIVTVRVPPSEAGR